ncbi:MAG TPA: hypothetical protein VGZ90_13270 [Puia sp.]|jgi:hypothetical protein|nr:hypothetical protein [Puia sp.]
MAITQGTLNKQFVSAISFLDQREINPNLIDQSRDATFVNIMKLVGRTKPTSVPIYNYFVNNDVFATGVVNSVSSGYGTSIIVLVLTAASGGYSRQGDCVRFSNANDIGRMGLITNVSSASSVDTITVQAVDGSPLYAVGNDTIGFISNANEEQSDKKANRKIGVTRFINQVQIFKEIDEISDVQKVSKVEVTVEGQPYYTPVSHIYKVNTLNGMISSACIQGVQSVTLFSDTNPVLTLNNRPVQTTMGMDQYISTFGATDQVATLGTVLLGDVAKMIDNFIANKAPLQQMGFSGTKAKRPWSNLMKNLGSSGITSVRLVIDGRDADLEIMKWEYSNAEMEFVHLPIFDHPQLFSPTVVPDIVGSIYWIPKDKVNVVGGGMEGRLQLRYLPKAMAGGTSNGLITEWYTGALAPTPTSSEQVFRTEWIANVGLEMYGVKHMQKYRSA